VERPVDGDRPVVPDLQPAGPADPGERPLDHPPDLHEPAPVRRPGAARGSATRRRFGPARFRGVRYGRSPYRAAASAGAGRASGGSAARRPAGASRESCRRAPVTRAASRTPFRSTRRWRLDPLFARSVGFLPGSTGCRWPPSTSRSPTPGRPGRASPGGASSTLPGAASPGAAASR
jgi:hypothetical protein